MPRTVLKTNVDAEAQVLTNTGLRNVQIDGSATTPKVIE